MEKHLCPIVLYVILPVRSGSHSEPISVHVFCTNIASLKTAPILSMILPIPPMTHSTLITYGEVGTQKQMSEILFRKFWISWRTCTVNFLFNDNDRSFFLAQAYLPRWRRQIHGLQCRNSRIFYRLKTFCTLFSTLLSTNTPIEFVAGS